MIAQRFSGPHVSRLWQRPAGLHSAESVRDVHLGGALLPRRAFRVVAEIDTDPPACTISGTPNGSPDLVFCSKLSMSEGSLTGRLSLWRGFWMVVSVSP